MRPTSSLPAPPHPATASLTWLGEYSATSAPRLTASASARPDAWATPMAVRALAWKNTRSTATASGRSSSMSARSSRWSSARRWGTGASAGVREHPHRDGRGAAGPVASRQP